MTVTASHDLAALDFEQFHRDTLPDLIAAGRGRLAGTNAARLAPIALRCAGGATFTYLPQAGSVRIVPGDADAATVIEIELEAWRGLVDELEAAAGLLYAGRVRSLRGAAVELMAWESTMRTLYTGRPPYDPERLDLRNHDGSRLDPQATFAASTNRYVLAHFLHTAGYLFVRDAFRPDEIAVFLREADELRAEARPGDKLSWWGKTNAGSEVVCRVTRANAKPGLATLPADPRLLALKDLADPAMVHKKGEGEGVTVIFKQPGLNDGGLGNLPWHRDCGMGGHAVMCPTVVLSLYLCEATPEAGELVMLPGSHRAAFNAHDLTLDPNAYAAHFAAQPGDVSVHFSDTVHAAPPPSAANRAQYRISAIVDFAHARAHHHRGEGSYNDVLHQRDDGQIEHLEHVAKRL